MVYSLPPFKSFPLAQRELDAIRQPTTARSEHHPQPIIIRLTQYITKYITSGVNPVSSAAESVEKLLFTEELLLTYFPYLL